MDIVRILIDYNWREGSIDDSVFNNGNLNHFKRHAAGLAKLHESLEYLGTWQIDVASSVVELLS